MKISFKKFFTTKITIILILLPLILFSTNFISKSKAQNQPQESSSPKIITLFDDEFSGSTLDPNVWNIYPNGGDISVSGGVLTLKGGSALGRFPFIQTKLNPLPVYDGSPQNDFYSIETSINIASGSGIGFEIPYVNNPQDPNQPFSIIPTQSNIQPAFGGILSAGVYLDSNQVVPALSAGWHTYKFNYYNGIVFVWIDGKQITASGTTRGAFLNFGNPDPNAVYDNNSVMRIRYIRVTEMTNL